jgi:putative membrane protein
MKIKSSTSPTATPQNRRPLKRIAGLALALCAAVLVTPSLNAAPKDTLNAADVKFIKEEAAAGRSVVKLAELAVQKAANPDVKALAQTLVTDHTGANSELSALAIKKGVDISAVIDPDTAKTFQDLEKVSGSEFDKAFLNAAVKGHQTCVENFQSASKEAQDGDLKMWVNKMTPVLQGHLALAEKLQSK